MSWPASPAVSRPCSSCRPAAPFIRAARWRWTAAKRRFRSCAILAEAARRLPFGGRASLMTSKPKAPARIRQCHHGLRRQQTQPGWRGRRGRFQADDPRGRAQDHRHRRRKRQRQDDAGPPGPGHDQADRRTRRLQRARPLGDVQRGTARLSPRGAGDLSRPLRRLQSLLYH